MSEVEVIVTRAEAPITKVTLELSVEAARALNRVLNAPAGEAAHHSRLAARNEFNTSGHYELRRELRLLFGGQA